MARTFGRYRGGGTADAYPARCSICSAVYPRNELRAQNGKLVCPQDWGADAATLDRANKARAPGPQRATRSDGLYRFPAETPIPFVPMDGFADNSGTRYSYDMPQIFGSLLHTWFRAGSASDFATETSGSTVVASSWKNRTLAGGLMQDTLANKPVFDATGFNGVPCLTNSTGAMRMAGTISPFLEIGSRPYLMVVARQNQVEAANRTFVIFGDPTGVFTSMRLRISGGRWLANMLRTGPAFDADEIDFGAVDTQRHLIEFGFLDATANAVVMDGIGTAGTYTTPSLRGVGPTMRIFTVITTTGPLASLAEIVLLNAIPSDAQLLAARTLLASSSRGYGLSVAGVNA